MLTLPLYVPAPSEPSVAVTLTAPGVELCDDVATSQLPPPIAVGDTVKLSAEPSLADICSVLAAGDILHRFSPFG
jgi:hypothetical protein